jgi:hypothetical protein
MHSGSGSATRQKVAFPAVPVPQHCDADPCENTYRIHNTENPNALLQIKLSQISDLKNCQIS